MSYYEKILQERLDERTESLRQAVASIDRLTAEREQGCGVRFNVTVSDSIPGVTASPPNYALAHYKHTARRLKDDVVKYQRETGELQAKVDTLRTAKNNLYDEVVQLRRANQALHDEVGALKAKTDTPPADHEDMAILGRYAARLFRRGYLAVESDPDLERSFGGGLRVKPSRTWGGSYLNSQSRLGQILLGLKK